MRIATPLFAFGKNADIGHSLQVLGDEGALELVRAFGRFAMTETNFVYSLRKESTVSDGAAALRREGQAPGVLPVQTVDPVILHKKMKAFLWYLLKICGKR